MTSGDTYVLYAVRKVHDYTIGCGIPIRAPIDGNYVNGCLTEFEKFIEGGRPTWVWFEELLGVLPPTKCIDKFTVKYSWMQETFGELPHGADDATVRRYARKYIMILLGTQLFGDKFSTRLHIRWLPYVARLEDKGGYSGGLAALSWLYMCMCRMANMNVVKLVSPLQLLQPWIFWRFFSFRPDGYSPFGWSLASR
ncbi:uncharacterized protein LOC107477431 [Arachis duranensis]|uniref:Uncharacterized protein LOC107477431 n=1 Tax=Arachis duranensis TaxID=130453 RepID=A0A6P4CK85_ARADU|nr:uncharacterized protein LOC107477431 [Arachis duranensis]